jgi:autoinducer 2-degrading protein
MHVVCVHVHVKEEYVEDFLAASVENGRATIAEPGNLRFDVLQRQDDPTRFLLYEVYRDADGMAAHKETPHYAKWRDTVADWMAEPREGVKYQSHFPTSEQDWNVSE